jgi:hypothetical protein
MPSFGDQSRSAESGPGPEWLLTARNLLASLSRAQDGIEVTLAHREIGASDSPATEFLAEQVESGFAWLEEAPPLVHADAATELRAALGVLRNLGFALRRLSMGEDNDALRRSCDALIDQSRFHVGAAARAVDEAERGNS